MKCKISKMLFAALALGLTVPGVSYAQEGKDLDYIVQNSNVRELEILSQRFMTEREANYEKAVKRAIELNMPISGYNEEEGYVFSLEKITEDGGLVYYRTFNNVSSGSSLTTVRAHYLHELGIEGQGMKIGIWDGGIPVAAHVSFLGRVVTKDNGAEVTQSPGTGVSHATHVAGTLAANENIPDIKGFMPQAEIWANNWQGDVSEMATQASQGLLVSNHSYGLDASLNPWGVGFFGRYGSDARDYDQIAFNAPLYTIVFAAGNDRASASGSSGMFPSKGGRDLLTQGGVSKNTVVVASAHGIQNYTSPSNVALSNFSNYGPTDDFRIKPDITTKGHFVKSAWPGGPASTNTESGTSMAAPAASGVFGLWQQYYNQKNPGTWMRSSTVRALMAHTALEAGPANGPDYMFGWGLLNAEEGAKVIEENGEGYSVIAEHTLTSGSVFEFPFERVDGSNIPLTVTIAWVDAPGTAINTGVDLPINSLVNDLDLRVINIDTNEEYMPWRLVKSFTTTGNGIAEKADNDVDNIEKVELGVVDGGNYKVVVSHKGSLAGGSQEFSIIMSGMGIPASADKFNKIEGLSVYPNPVTNVLNIASQEISLNGAEVQLLDTSGRIVRNVKINNQTKLYQIGLSDITSGIYMVKVQLDNKMSIIKIIKK